MAEYSNLYFWRQHLILATVLFLNLTGGFMAAFPSVLNPSILAPNGTDIRATMDEASWIASSAGISAVPAFIILPMIMQRFGRKVTNILLNALIMIGWIIFSLAKSITALLSARIIQGFSFGASIVSVVLIAEYSDPKRRGYFMVTKKLFLAIGILLCHVMYLSLTWRQIAGVSISFNIISIIMTLFWPESPAFLATRNRFNECEKSFVWLHGSENKQELVDLISSQEEKLKNILKSKKTVRYFYNRFLSKDFQKAFFISVLTWTLVETCGRHYFAVYLIQIVVELLGDKSLAVYVSIGNDVLSVIGLCVAIVIVKRFKRRTLLFSFGGFAVFLMLITSATLFLKSSYPLASLNWWSVAIILIFSLITNIGVIPIAFTVMGEVFPLDSRGLGVSLSGIAFAIILSLTLKVTPLLISRAGLSGTFLINACVTAVSLLILHFILPETKDKTLLDIEFEMKGEKKVYRETRPMI